MTDPHTESPLLSVITPRARDIGDFTVRRVLPVAGRRQLGPFVFFDHLGPVEQPAGQGMDVRPHPHIGIATVTYLFEGSFVHRDSLGVVQRIEPGAINWMIAGRGVTHSERTDAPERAAGQRLHAIQCWVALPVVEEERPPSFTHHPANSLPVHTAPGVVARVLAGTAFGLAAPAPVLSPTLYVDVTIRAGASLPIPLEHAERAVYPVAGSVAVRLPDGRQEPLQPEAMSLLHPGQPVELVALSDSRAMLVGGAPLDGPPRQIFWNFVSSRAERLEQAKADWRAGRFPAVPGETEFIPLPE